MLTLLVYRIIFRVNFRVQFYSDLNLRPRLFRRLLSKSYQVSYRKFSYCINYAEGQVIRIKKDGPMVRVDRRKVGCALFKPNGWVFESIIHHPEKTD